MNKKSFLFGFIIIVSGLCITGTAVLSAAEQGQSLVLFDFAGSFNVGSVITSDAKATLSKSGALRI